MRALGFTSLFSVAVYVILAAVCLGMGISYVLEGGNFFKVLALLFVWPLIRWALLAFNRYIMLDGDRMIFHVEQAHRNLLQLPKFYVEEITLDELTFYGTYSDLYVKNVKKANRKKGSKEHYDIVTVKDGDIEIPVGTLKFGRPLAFVTKTHDSYVYDDAIFSEDQMAYLFYLIQKRCGMAPTGDVEARQISNNVTSSVMTFTVTIVMLAVLCALGLCLPFAESLLTKVPFVFLQYTQLQTVYVALFIGGSIAAAIAFGAWKGLFGSNKERDSIISFLAAIIMAILYGASVLFLAIACL